MIALRASSFLSRAGQPLAVLCAMGLFAWVAAHWIWRALEPSVATPSVVVGDVDWSARILAGNAFGFTRADAGPASAGGPSTAGIEDRVRLMGLAREPGERSRGASQALFKIDNKRILWLRPGEELDAGIVLAAIDPDGVRLRQDGREVRIPLRGRAGASPARAPGAVAQGGAVVRASVAGDACRLQPEQRARAYVLRPEIVDTVMRERSTWVDLFKPTAVGLVVQNPGGTGAMLGLYGNDLLAKADGAQLGSVDDVLRLVLQPLARNDTVTVTGSRGGQPREWIYAGMNCLPR